MVFCNLCSYAYTTILVKLLIARAMRANLTFITINWPYFRGRPLYGALMTRLNVLALITGLDRYVENCFNKFSA